MGRSAGRHVKKRTWHLPSVHLPSWRRPPTSAPPRHQALSHLPSVRLPSWHWHWPRRPTRWLASGLVVLAALAVVVLAARAGLARRSASPSSSSPPRVAAPTPASGHAGAGSTAAGRSPAAGSTAATSAPVTVTQPPKTGCPAVAAGMVPVQPGTYPLSAQGERVVTSPSARTTSNITGGSLVVDAAAGHSQTLRLELTGPGLTISRVITYTYQSDGAHLDQDVAEVVSQGVATTVNYAIHGAGYVLPAAGFQTGQSQAFDLGATSHGNSVSVHSVAQCKGTQAVTVGSTSDLTANVVQNETETVSDGGHATETDEEWLHPPSPLPVQETGHSLSTSADGTTSAQINYTLTLTSQTPQ